MIGVNGYWFCFWPLDNGRVSYEFFHYDKMIACGTTDSDKTMWQLFTDISCE